uniref:Alpha 1,3-galactosyltransferase 2 n=1 Tax=Neogobius melanostomus TaxID=47308 RepID=A0A8C6UUS4_9GOBI
MRLHYCLAAASSQKGNDHIWITIISIAFRNLCPCGSHSHLPCFLLLFLPRARKDVPTTTYWGAPIIWEGTFDPTLFDEAHKLAQSSVALTVFAVGKYLDVYLRNFLVSAEKHFMPGLPVTYLVFTDQSEEVPALQLGALRDLRVLPVHKRWQDISMMRMKTISDIIQNELRWSHSHVFCFDVDQVFTGRWGSEALGESVAQIHSEYYKTGIFTYDRNPMSRAYLPRGDWYYHAAVFGGSWQKVKELVDFCYAGIMEDKRNNVEAVWHDESHLNKYFYLHRPTRLLSSEYCWSPAHGSAAKDVRVHRLEWAQKFYNVLRT